MTAGLQSATLLNAKVITGGGADFTSGAVDLAGKYGAVVGGKILNGSSGPTVAGQIQIEVSYDADGTTYFNCGGAIVGGTGNNEAVHFGPIELPMGITKVRAVCGSNTDQAVTYYANLSMVYNV